MNIAAVPDVFVRKAEPVAALAPDAPGPQAPIPLIALTPAEATIRCIPGFGVHPGNRKKSRASAASEV